MKEEKDKLSHNSQSSVGGIVLFLLVAVLFIYFLVPTTGTLVDRNVANGSIKNCNNQLVVVNYVNAFDGKTYYLQRKLDSRLEAYLQSNAKTVPVVYSRYFPENGWLPSVEKDHAVFAVISILVIVLTAFRVLTQDLVKHFRQVK